MTSLNLNPYWLLGVALGITALSSLAVLRAPALPFWYTALLVTEWGYWDSDRISVQSAFFALGNNGRPLERWISDRIDLMLFLPRLARTGRR